MAWRRRPVGRLALGAALALALGWATAAGAQPADTVAGTLQVAAWRGAFLGRGADGTVALLAGPDGTCRAEVGEGPVALASLLARQGRGWTLVLPAVGDAVLQPWDREWRRLPADLAAGLRAVAQAVADPAGGGPRRRHVLPPAGPSPGLRAALAARGRGRGGPGEVLTVVRRGDPAAGGALAVRSSRRPGSLTITALRSLPVAYAPDEVFVPLWPLADLLDPGPQDPENPQNPGTRPPFGG
ncbi:MAG: hypothetical protein R6X35_13595 [Candidatus Krumholzibacteriia bacterium]